MRFGHDSVIAWIDRGLTGRPQSAGADVVDNHVVGDGEKPGAEPVPSIGREIGEGAAKRFGHRIFGVLAVVQATNPIPIDTLMVAIPEHTKRLTLPRQSPADKLVVGCL